MSLTRDELRGNLLRFTEAAFHLLPDMNHPRILDIGCGSGVPTVRLLELSDGEVIGLDNDPRALAALKERAKARGVDHRLKIQLGSLDSISFEDQSFDLLWCEGALRVLGFRDSLRGWRSLLRPGGYLVAHDEAGDTLEKLRTAEAEGYTVQGFFIVSEEVWWNEYYALAEARLASGEDADLPMGENAEIAQEIAFFRQNPQRSRSAFFVLKNG